MHPSRLTLFVAAALLASSCRQQPSSPDAGQAPDAPAAVQASVLAGAIRLEWLSEGEADEFVIARAPVDQAQAVPALSELVIIGSTQATERAFEDPDVETGRFYVYAVAARGPGGRSAFTLQAGTVALSAPPSPCQGAISPADGDGDGLADADEGEGWAVLIDEDGRGTLTTRFVKSSPWLADTDGDGVCDAQESSLRIDPRQADTDGDGLTDLEELNRWGSSPTNVDTDGDAQGNSAFYDGAELLGFATSPTLADTDGDGRTDFEEINQNGTNALAAELPMPRLRVVSKMNVEVNLEFEDGSADLGSITHGFEQGTSSNLTRTSATSNQVSTESSWSLSAEATVGYPASASIEVTGTYSQKEGYVQETSSSFSRQSQSSAQQSYEEVTSKTVSKNETVTGGTISLDFAIENPGTRSFQISSVVITALRRDPLNPTSFTSIATLALPSTADSLVLAEGQSTGPLRAEADISASVALDLLANPGDLFFRTANFNLVDRTGQAFQFAIGEETSSRTALLTIDYGGLRPLERHRVATNVERTSNGKAAGVRLGDALERILGLARGIGYQTQTRAGDGGVQVITRVRDVATLAGPDGGTQRFWVLMAPQNPDATLAPITQRALSRLIDVEDAVLMPRDSLTLAFVGDSDGDGLFEREELAFGTSDLLPDSDGDGLTDFQEVREGWTVTVDSAFYRAHPTVRSIPTTIDSDGDSWSDLTEKQRGTDPHRRDTDADGLSDNLDPFPTQGPRGTWVKVLGTAGDEEVLEVAAGAGTVYLLGTSTGDLDGDLSAGGPFLMAVEPATGATRWTLQLEGTTRFSKKVVVGADGTVTWIAEVRPGVLPGVITAAMYLLRVDPAGLVSTATNLTDVPTSSANEVTLLASGAQEPRAGGGTLWFTLRPGDQLALRTQAFDGSGAPLPLGPTSQFIPDAATIVDSSSVGLLSALSLSWPSGCEARLLREGQLASSLPCQSLGSGRLGKLELDRQGALYLALNESSGDRLERRSLAGGLLWSRDFAPTFTTPRLTALDLDESDQVFVGVQDTGTPAGLEVLSPAGARLGLMRLGNATTRLTSSRRDAVGNLFVGGTTLGGFESWSPNRGGGDLLLTRNPQLTFGP